MQYPNINTRELEAYKLKNSIIKYEQQIPNNLYDSVYAKLYRLENRRYIGCKAKLINWIFNLINQEIKNANSFCDIFAGTGSVSNRALSIYNKVIINDFLHSNNILYKAFFAQGEWNKNKIAHLLHEFNNINPDKIGDNYFSENYGGKYFDKESAKLIGYIRDIIEDIKSTLTEKEYCILIASLIYSMDRIANTLGHFDAYINKEIRDRKFRMGLIDAKSFPGVEIYKEDANALARNIHVDILYMDPPYNSRQYSRFYHVYEVLVKWNKPELKGKARKPLEENMSDYCRVKAFQSFTDLIAHVDAKYIVVSYNNTYNSKSTSSENKIKLEQIESILNQCGTTKIFTHNHQAFNAGKTEFDNHKEYLFITKINDEKRTHSFASILCR